MTVQAERIIATNKKAFFNYEIIETLEAGISLLGSEVKSIREGKVSLKESYAEIKDGEVFLINCHIAPYSAATYLNHEPKRPRKLLLHKQEIKKLMGRVKEKGLTLIPVRMYFNKKGLVKVELALAKGKKVYQKREALRERDRRREMEAELKKYKRSF
ncbi:SsrA-binding protein SmpB [Candidatus Aminicenantes bacterium AC-335-A11]|jgi:SsrA-binding protein|nr:SsrA-binding protein SmpB [SCandidatus Aminicenantes bacterium Aminicenantia_JdfR_composite]MCP2598359.1 SsrA-binding protein SmpB [Candidatus Aminicenantes bacterium AC-335-L06]MCP2618920.1 SsrA-binding protein SmpB [Candidatus Aminicenantes bacterium AC-335-A11]MCP2620781.1 SsrA-binding protein SmpB [Candidatus Aminicenantes bacterium AC-334-E05]